VQFLSRFFGVYVGKVETLDGDANEFAHNFRTQFLNMGLQFNLTNIVVPVSASQEDVEFGRPAQGRGRGRGGRVSRLRAVLRPGRRRINTSELSTRH
jgi:hypothetical protein